MNKYIALLFLTFFSLDSFSQKLIKGKEKREEIVKFNKDSSVKTITIRISRTDTVKTKYSPEINEIKREVQDKLEEYLEFKSDIQDKIRIISNLENEKSRSQKKINELSSKNSEQEKKIEKLENQLTTAKNNFKTDVNTILQSSSSMYSNDQLEDVRKRLVAYGDMPRLLEKLKLYIKYRNIVLKAKNPLTNSYDQSSVNDQIIKIENVYWDMDKKDYSGVYKEMTNIKDVLESYEDKCSEITSLFSRLKRARGKENILEDLEPVRSDYKDYKFILKEIDDAINQIKSNDDPKKVFKTNFGC